MLNSSEAGALELVLAQFGLEHRAVGVRKLDGRLNQGLPIRENRVERVTSHSQRMLLHLCAGEPDLHLDTKKQQWPAIGLRVTMWVLLYKFPLLRADIHGPRKQGAARWPKCKVARLAGFYLGNDCASLRLLPCSLLAGYRSTNQQHDSTFEFQLLSHKRAVNGKP